MMPSRSPVGTARSVRCYELDFVEDEARWGYCFRFGVFKIDEHDFAAIRSAMTA